MEDLLELGYTKSSTLSISVCGELQPTRKRMAKIREGTMDEFISLVCEG